MYLTMVSDYAAHLPVPTIMIIYETVYIYIYLYKILYDIFTDDNPIIKVQVVQGSSHLHPPFPFLAARHGPCFLTEKRIQAFDFWDQEPEEISLHLLLGQSSYGFWRSFKVWGKRYWKSEENDLPKSRPWKFVKNEQFSWGLWKFVNIDFSCHSDEPVIS